MIRKLAWIFGVVLLLVGVLGFVPMAVMDGKLLGIFMVDPVHNIIHLASGVAAIAGALAGAKYARLYFKVFGIVYALVTVLGFILGGNLIFIMVNMADNILHLVIAAGALYIGFGMKD